MWCDSYLIMFCPFFSISLFLLSHGNISLGNVGEKHTNSFTVDSIRNEVVDPNRNEHLRLLSLSSEIVHNVPTSQ